MSAYKHIPIGTRFGRWVTTGHQFHKYPSQTGYYTPCLCDCGTVRDVSCSALRNGGSISCGCYKLELPMPRHETHGLSGKKTYRTYVSMLARTTNPNAVGYKHYGGRGIKVSEDWLKGFEFFYKDIGEIPPGMSIERVDVNGPYSKGNCILIPRAAQAKNKTNTRYLQRSSGERRGLSEWSEITGLHTTLILYRLRKGWSVDRALDEPAISGRNQNSDKKITFNGKSLLLKEWAAETGISYNAILNRKRYGWSIERMLTQPQEIQNHSKGRRKN